MPAVSLEKPLCHLKTPQTACLSSDAAPFSSDTACLSSDAAPFSSDTVCFSSDTAGLPSDTVGCFKPSYQVSLGMPTVSLDKPTVSLENLINSLLI